jgi:2-hydroxychromene-2-carboxylate isomerase
MAGSSTVNPSDQPVFYYDLGSPRCYTVAEAIMSTLPVVPEWEPVLGSQLAPASASIDCADIDGAAIDDADIDRTEIESQAAALGLQPIRWPARWPPDTEVAMLAATYAKQIGRAVAFSLAAFRQAFAGGRDLGDENTILIAGAACEMHPTALRKGIELRSTRQALEQATRRARTAGVTRLPAIQIGDRAYATIDEATSAIHGAIR